MHCLRRDNFDEKRPVGNKLTYLEEFMRKVFVLAIRTLVVVLVATVFKSSFASTEIRAEWYRGTCPKGLPTDVAEAPQKLAPLLAGVVAVIVPKIVSGGVDLAAKRLQAAGEDRPNSMSARTDEYFYSYLRERKNVLHVRCLILVEADNFNGTATPTEPHPWRVNAPRVGSYQNERMIFMAAVETAPEGKLFRLVPAYMEIKDWRESSFFNRAHRDYSIVVSLTAIGAEKSFASVTMEFKDVERNKIYTAADALLGGATTDYVPLAQLSAEGTKHISNVESAWASKDKAAEILDAKQRFDNQASDRAAGKIPPSMPELYENPYLEKLNGYCSAVRVANQYLEKSKRETPQICNWELDKKLALAGEAKQAVERSVEWLTWAQETCWHDPATRAEEIAKSHPKGHECSEPGSLANKTKPHTRIATLAVVTEVIPGSKAAKFLGNALSESKADVSKVIVDKLPALTAEARSTEEAAERALRQAVIEADYKVELAENELAELPEDAPASKVTEKRMKRQAAWYAANNAYRAVGRTPPYPEVGI